MREAFVPPNPKELVIAFLIFFLRGFNGTKSNSSSPSSTSVKLRVGGTISFKIERIE